MMHILTTGLIAGNAGAPRAPFANASRGYGSAAASFGAPQHCQPARA